jgi:hypothetical protein
MPYRSPLGPAAALASVAPDVTGVQSSAIDAFISYASPDSSIAEAVCSALEREGVVCWIAPRDVVPGAFYADAIVRAIDAAKVVVLVLSQYAAASPHVLREIERATSKRRVIVSFRIDLMAMPPALEYFLNASHWLDTSASGMLGALPKLVDAVKLLLAPSTIPAYAPSAPREKSPSSAMAAGGTVVGTTSIAVLPFANMSADQDQEYSPTAWPKKSSTCWPIFPV